MLDYKNIVIALKNRSNIDYEYYHLFNNKNLILQNQTYYTKKFHIIYLNYSNLKPFYAFFKENHKESITDVFIERCELSDSDKKKLFSIVFKDLFWLRLNNINLLPKDTDLFVSFLANNELDINRIFIENCSLDSRFLYVLSQKKNLFRNITFLNLDNNNIGDKGVVYLIDFLQNNNIHLEYLSLVKNNIWEIWIHNLIEYFLSDKNSILRILDISWNVVWNKNEEKILRLIEQSQELKEIYIKNSILSNNFIEEIIGIIENKRNHFYILKLSLTEEQFHYKKTLLDVWNQSRIIVDVDIIDQSKTKIYTTIYLKEFKDTEIKNFTPIKTEYFYLINSDKQDESYEELFSENKTYLKDGINLFLFDISDYTKIFFLLENYNFNYIYLENYHISDENFVRLIEKIRDLWNKYYKINLVSIPLNEYQLSYLIDNLPKNIYYIEINLNKIDVNRERYISKMCKNSAFIFENMELYKKLF